MTTPRFEISDRFRLAVEKRISRLERGAIFDAEQLPHIVSEDHRKRQMQLIDIQVELAVQLRTRLSFAGAISPDFILSPAYVPER